MSQLLAEETPVFSYSFGGLKHSVHGSDAMYWRGSPKGTLPALMSTYLANFARTGDPNEPPGADRPVWNPGYRSRMHFGNLSEMMDLKLEDQEWYQFLAVENKGKNPYIIPFLILM